jgi:hypothetical protein
VTRTLSDERTREDLAEGAGFDELQSRKIIARQGQAVNLGF